MTAVNIVIGTMIAWVLVRDDFPGKRILEVVIDIPFALPTIVAGLVLLSLYGPSSPLGLEWANTPKAVFLAFLFVTLPFIVRTVEPVLLELEPEVEEAAASLGASRFTTFRTIILPSLAPAITSGAALSFARAISEYGSLVLLSGNLPYSTEVASVRILSYVEGDQADRGGRRRLHPARRGTRRHRRPRCHLSEGGAQWLTPPRTPRSSPSGRNHRSAGCFG